MATPTGRQIGPYHLEQELGRGGYGIVYRAHSERDGSVVALKVLHPAWASEPAALQRFEREAKAMSRLHHPNIVQVYEVSLGGAEPYLAMELVQGSTLKERIPAGGMPLSEALPILQSVAAALTAIHHAGMTHRDVKPSNILLTSTGQVKLTDFGIVKLHNESDTLRLTGTYQVMGSAAYMAPEQIDPVKYGSISSATDIYTLGVVAYEMLTGSPPFSGSADATLIAHLQQQPLSPAKLNPAIPAATAQAVLKALSKAPNARPNSVSAFVQALEEGAQPTRRHTSLPAVLPVTDPLPLAPPRPSPPRDRRLPTRLLFLLLLLGLVSLGAWSLRSRIASGTAGTVATPTVDISLVSPTIPLSVTTQLAAPSPTVTPLPAVGQGGDGMGLLTVPGGSFLMGGLQGAGERAEERPVAEVEVAPFVIDQTEVTNEMYQRCVVAGGCRPPRMLGSLGQASYYNNPAFAAYPVIHVTWDDAANYCAWVGRRLPTEAEWEKAARGPNGALYPWGDTPPTGDRLNFCDSNCPDDPDGLTSSEDDGAREAAPVGSYPNGTSPYGALDMLGNVWEWVADSYEQDPTRRMIRGGSFYDDGNLTDAAYRRALAPETALPHLGFRCAQSP